MAGINTLVCQREQDKKPTCTFCNESPAQLFSLHQIEIILFNFQGYKCHGNFCRTYFVNILSSALEDLSTKTLSDQESWQTYLTDFFCNQSQSGMFQKLCFTVVFLSIIWRSMYSHALRLSSFYSLVWLETKLTDCKTSAYKYLWYHTEQRKYCIKRKTRSRW